MVFFCALPDCSYKTNTSLALGKRSICWRCGNDFIMDEYSLRLAKPHCSNCHKPRGMINDGKEDIIETMKELSLTEKLQQTIREAQQDDGEI